jgi:hypothetical protein
VSERGSGRGGGPLGFERDDDDPWGDREALAERGVEAGPGGPGRPTGGARLPAGASRTGWFVGVVVVLFLAVVTINAVRSHGPGSRGVRVGEAMPPFAAPLALGALEGDVNVAREAGQGEAGEVPACRLRGPQILNVCQLYERGPVVLAFTASRGRECTRQLDTIERLRPRHPGVQFAAVSIRGDRSDLRKLVRGRGWTFPVGYDHDGILANLYGVAVCPQVTFALPGGRVTGTSLGEAGPGELDRRVRRLEAAARERGWTPPAPR